MEYVVRVVLDADAVDVYGLTSVGRSRLTLADLPAGAWLVVDVTGCSRPVPEAARLVADAARRGVQVEVVADSAYAAQTWRLAVLSGGVS